MENTSEVLEVARKLGAGKITCKVQKYLLDEVIGNEVREFNQPHFFSLFSETIKCSKSFGGSQCRSHNRFPKPKTRP